MIECVEMLMGKGKGERGRVGKVRCRRGREKWLSEKCVCVCVGGRGSYVRVYKGLLH